METGDIEEFEQYIEDRQQDETCIAFGNVRDRLARRMFSRPRQVEHSCVMRFVVGNVVSKPIVFGSTGSSVTYGKCTRPRPASSPPP